MPTAKASVHLGKPGVRRIDGATVYVPLAVAGTTGSISAEKAPERTPEADLLRMIDQAAVRNEGLGDTIKSAIESLGLDRAAKFYERVTGLSCGCEKRRAWLNRWWPYRQ